MAEIWRRYKETMQAVTSEPQACRDGWKEGMRYAAEIAAAAKYDKRGETGSWAYACDVISGRINIAAGIAKDD